MVTKDTDSNDDQLVRPLVLNAALYAENPSAESEAHEIFTQNQDKLLSLSSDIRALVLQNEVKNYNSSQLFESLLEDYRKTSDSSYKQDILFALTSTKMLTKFNKLYLISKMQIPSSLKICALGTSELFQTI